MCLVGVAAGAGPGEGVVCPGGDGPCGVGFESVVVSAQGVEVVGAGGSGGPGGGVVEVAAGGAPAAAGEAAVPVAGLDEGLQFRCGPVAGCGGWGCGQVDDVGDAVGE